MTEVRVHGDGALLPVSALQHYLYCDRQCALIHLERVWIDNRLTVEGTRMHAKPDAGHEEARGHVVIARAVPIVSKRLGLTGKADVVEFHRAHDGRDGALLEHRDGRWRVVPVEYKRGRPKRHSADEVQLCAQALCLEEMFQVRIEQGYLYYGARRRRTEVAVDHSLRSLTEETVSGLRRLLTQSDVPRPDYTPQKCDACSLKPACLPKAEGRTDAYVNRTLRALGAQKP